MASPLVLAILEARETISERGPREEFKQVDTREVPGLDPIITVRLEGQLEASGPSLGCMLAQEANYGCTWCWHGPQQLSAPSGWASITMFLPHSSRSFVARSEPSLGLMPPRPAQAFGARSRGCPN